MASRKPRDQSNNTQDDVKATPRSEPLTERTNKVQATPASGKTASVTSQELTVALFKSQEVIGNLKEQLQEKAIQLQEATKELDYYKTATTEPSRLVAQLEFTKMKLALTEQKHTKMEVELVQVRGEMAQLHSALEIANRMIQILQEQIQDSKQDQV